MIGAFQPQMLRLAARYADWWNVSSRDAANYRQLAAQFARACSDVGRNPATMRRSWIGGCACAPTQEAAERIAGDHADGEEDFGFVGTPQQVVAQMRPFIELGVEQLVLDCGDFPQLTTLDLLIKEVLPAVND